MQDLIQYVPIVVIVVFFFALAIQLFYYSFFYTRLAFHKHKSSENEREPLSVIICAKNEAEHLQQFLPLVLEQDYPEFEVVVVNDCSSDDTEMVLAQLKMKYEKLRYTNIVEDSKFKHNKKLAVTVGVKAAKYEHIVLTDADCYPTSRDWLLGIQQSFGWTKEIVVGYGGYEERKGFLNKIIRYDSLNVALNFIGFAKAGVPYMGVGRNLAYKKSTFFRNKGFATNYELASGDDDLFVNETASKHNVAVTLNDKNIIRSVPKETFRDYFLQKRRHITTAKRYLYKHQVLLGLELVSRLLLYVSFAAAMFVLSQPLVWYLLAAFSLRLIVQLTIVKLSMIKLNEKNLLLYSPIFDLCMPIILFMVYISNLLDVYRRKNRWK